jgi:hypothetical protein
MGRWLSAYLDGAKRVFVLRVAGAGDVGRRVPLSRLPKGGMAKTPRAGDYIDSACTEHSHMQRSSTLRTPAAGLGSLKGCHARR